jgi:hypothetical protein
MEESDGSYLLDQETYAKHILNRFCGKHSEWDLPPMQSTPAPVGYIHSKSNRPQTDEERREIEKKVQRSFNV